MASKLKVNKTTSVVVAVVYVNDDLSPQSYTNHARMLLHSNLDRDSFSKVAELRFQRNALDRKSILASYDQYGTAESVKADLPPNEFDFGRIPYGRFYAPQVDMTYEFSADGNGAIRMEQMAKLVRKVMATAEDHNMRTVCGGDSLKLWVDTLRKLGVEVEIRYNGIERWKPEGQPAYTLYKRMRDEEEGVHAAE